MDFKKKNALNERKCEHNDEHTEQKIQRREYLFILERNTIIVVNIERNKGGNKHIQ